MGIFILIPKKERFVQEKIKEYNTQITNFITDLKKEPFIEEGTISGTLRYIGAHNEPYETEIVNHFLVQSNHNQTMVTLSTKQNSLSILCEQDLLELMNLWRKETDIENILEIKEIKQEKDVIVTLNPDKINQILNKNYQKATITFQFTGIIPTIKNAKLQLDDSTVTIENNIISINTVQNQITITLQKNGYLLSINENFKIQKEQKNDSNIYHIVKNDVALTLTTTKDEIRLSTSTKKEQFHSMDLTLKQENKEDLQTTIGNIEQFPILKYLKALHIIDWRETLD